MSPEQATIITALISLIGAIITLSYQALQYLDRRKQELRDKRFRTYHDLIRDLVQPGEKGSYLDRQIAIAFELRNFPEYAEVTQRILAGLRETWAQNPAYKRLITELDLSMAHLQKSVTQKRPNSS